MEIYNLNCRKKMLVIIASILLCSTNVIAQNTVVIPDANFATWLNTNIPAAMSGGNLMDTTDVDVTTRGDMNVSSLGITDLSGIQYFSSLVNLNCSNNQLSSLPTLPGALAVLFCKFNQLTSLPALPGTLQQFVCNNNQLTSLPLLPTSLAYLNCSDNPLTNLPTLPNSMTGLDCNNNILNNLPVLPGTLTLLGCSYNLLSSIPALPGGLTFLGCANNQLTSLPALPGTLTELICNNNQLDSVPTLPGSLTFLDCSNNQLSVLPSLPGALTNMICYSNQLINLPVLPGSLKYMLCFSNQLNNLPALPGSIATLDCSYNQLNSLPALPVSLTYLICSFNQLSSLPTLPGGITTLECSSNQLNSLPTLPNSLTALRCSNNSISCFPTFPNALKSAYFDISANPFNCLPNYIPAMDTSILVYPLCQAGNSNGCSNVKGIAGFIYKDLDSNCTKESTDLGLKNIPVKLYDTIGNLLLQIYTATNGVYHFTDTSAGAYTVVIDTTGMPYTTQCLYPGVDSTLALSGLSSDINFPIICKLGVDVGVLSVVTNGLVFPGQQHHLRVVAGDLTQWFNLDCASGTSGTVDITVNGPVSYMGPGLGSLNPTVAGNVYTYAVTDFATINNTTDFNLLFTTDTTAQAGDTICVNILVTSTASDNNISNNNYSYCYSVINSHDPNIKEVYPVDVVPSYDGWFTYSIHFQNTGSAPAINIRLADTLDSNLDLTTFQLINYSHFNQTSLVGNVLTFRFPGIYLPDSLSNPEGSIGFVQYRIKAKPNLPGGSLIHNTGYIYFDYNPAIVTNTTENAFMISTHVSSESAIQYNINAYPNPFTDIVTFVFHSKKMGQLYSIEIMDVLGKTVYIKRGIPSERFQVSRNTLQSGIYFYKIYSLEENIGSGKVMIE